MNNPFTIIFLYFHHLHTWYCIDIVRRNFILVTHGSYGAMYLYTNQFLNVPGNGCTLDIPRRDGELERGLLVGDLDRWGLGRVKELKSRFSNKPSSLWRTRNGLLWFARVSSGLGSGVLVSLRREGEGDRGTCLEPVGLTDRRLVLNVLFVRRSSTPES